MNRLTQAIGSAYGTENYTYNAIGNMTDKDGITMNYGENGAGPHAVTSVSGSTLPRYCEALQTCTMSYDANGNMTNRGVDELQYDSENRLKQINVYEGSDGTHNFTLAQGWNVISFAYLPQNKSITSVLSDMTWGTDYSQVSWWDEATDEWKHFVNDPDFNDFDTFEYGKTYEIYVETVGGETPSVSGTSPGTEQTYSLKAGDNFISPPVESATSVSNVLSSLTLDTDYSDVKRYNTGTASWESWDNGDFTNFEPGAGYNIVGLQDASFNFGGDVASTTTFVYDATGARVKKTVDSTTTLYLGKDYEKEGSVTTKHIFLGDRRISTKKSDGTLEFIHSDHINSSNIITDENGDQTGLLEYAPYGATATHTGTADPKHKFTGHEEDSASGLYFANARYYDPAIGRFITADPTVQHPVDPQDFNRYAYARNNPIKFTDPTGFGFFSSLFSFLGAVIGAAIGNAIAPGIGFFIGAVIGGAIGGAIGGTIDAAIKGDSIARGAIFGAAEGAVTGAMIGATGQPGSSGSNSGPQIKILQTPSELNDPVIEITGVAQAIGESGASAEGQNILGNIVASAVQVLTEPGAKRSIGSRSSQGAIGLLNLIGGGSGIAAGVTTFLAVPTPVGAQAALLMAGLGANSVLNGGANLLDAVFNTTVTNDLAANSDFLANIFGTEQTTVVDFAMTAVGSGSAAVRSAGDLFSSVAKFQGKLKRMARSLATSSVTEHVDRINDIRSTIDFGKMVSRPAAAEES